MTLTTSEIDLLVQRFDYNSNGYITMNDFLRFARASKGSSSKGSKGSKGSSRQSSKQQLANDVRKIIQHSETSKGLSLRDAFGAFDKNSSGTISRKECTEMLRRLGFHSTEEESRFLFSMMDENNDDAVQLSEFQRFVRQNSQDSPDSQHTEDEEDEEEDSQNMWRSSTMPKVPVELESVQQKIVDAISKQRVRSSTFDLESIFEQFDRRLTGEVTTQELRYVLMDLKLSLLENDEMEMQNQDLQDRAERKSRQLER